MIAEEGVVFSRGVMERQADIECVGEEARRIARVLWTNPTAVPFMLAHDLALQWRQSGRHCRPPAWTGRARESGTRISAARAAGAAA